MGKYIGSAWWKAKGLSPVRVGDIKPAEGLRVVDGLVVKEYRQGTWISLGVATQADLRTYPTVVDDVDS